MSKNCVFCQIIAGKAPGEIVYRDEQVTVFEDLHPASPVHLLIVPNRHISSLNHASENDAQLLGYMIMVARKLSEQKQINQDGYRLVINTGPAANQTVPHLHLHLLGGQRLPGLAR